MYRIFTLLFLFAFSFTRAQDSPVDYMKSIGEPVQNTAVEMMRYVSAAAHSKRARKIEKRRKGLVKATTEAIKTLKKLPAYQKDVAFRDATANAMELSLAVFNDDYAKIVDMEAVAEQSYDLMEAFMLAKDMANEKLDRHDGSERGTAGLCLKVWSHLGGEPVQALGDDEQGCRGEQVP